jgi:hypothetical protein
MNGTIGQMADSFNRLKAHQATLDAIVAIQGQELTLMRERAEFQTSIMTAMNSVPQEDRLEALRLLVSLHQSSARPGPLSVSADPSNPRQPTNGDYMRGDFDRGTGPLGDSHFHGNGVGTRYARGDDVGEGLGYRQHAPAGEYYNQHGAGQHGNGGGVGGPPYPRGGGGDGPARHYGQGRAYAAGPSNPREGY